MPLVPSAAIQSARTALPGALLLTLFMLAHLTFALAQDSVLVRRQATQRSREYLSVDVQPLFRTAANISSTTGKDVMRRLNTPGFAAGFDYSRVSLSGFTVLAGIHFRMIPVAYKFDIDYNDFPVGGPSTNNFGTTNVNLVNGHL